MPPSELRRSPGYSDRAADLDHAATTRLRSEARDAMEPFLGDRYGNPSGSHALARDAVRAVDEAREQVAGFLGCGPGDVVFTSGGTEADNHAVTGGIPVRPGVPVCSAVEHHAVLEPVQALGGRVVGVDAKGRVDTSELDAVLTDLGDSVSVVSVMLANNEVGTVNDLERVRDTVRAHSNAPIHTDAVQAAAWLDLGTAATAADMISISAHKFGGPKGVGALVCRQGHPLHPLLRGGGQERGRRSGTTNVAGVVGLSAALAATVAGRDAAVASVGALRDRLGSGLRAAVPGLRETVVTDAGRDHLLPGICHVIIPDLDTEALLLLLEDEGVLASAAASCASGAQQASHVLVAIGADQPGAGALRLSLGWDSTAQDVDRALRAVPQAVAHIRESSSVSGNPVGV